MTQTATCSSALTQPFTLSKEFRIIPAGRFKAIDGRPGLNQYWNLSEATGKRMVAEAASRKQDYLIDYEHQSLSGQQAPAAGWFNTLTWKPDGLYVQMAKWTDAAKAMIGTNEYRFISPVFTFDKETFEVQTLVSIALTNTPALPELTDLSSVALTQQGIGIGNLQEQIHIATTLGLSIEALCQAVAEDTNTNASIQTDKNTGLQGKSLEVFNQVFPELNAKNNAALTQIEALNVVTLTDKDRHNLERMIGQPLTGQQATLTSVAAIQNNPQASHGLQGKSLEVFNQVFPELSR